MLCFLNDVDLLINLFQIGSEFIVICVYFLANKIKIY
jgi:hypothetical protein